MKVSDVMTQQVICISPGESVEVAARMLARNNIGALPVCDSRGALQGIVTDRDLVTRCMAANKKPADTTVGQVMSRNISIVKPDTDLGVAAHLMGRCQVRRLPVVENGVVCGMVSLGDLACRPDSVMDAADAMADITENIRDTSKNPW